MLNFTYQNRTRIVFGRDTHRQIGVLLKPMAGKVLLHYGGSSIRKSGLYDRVTASLTEAGVAYVELGGVQPNPRVSLCKEGVKLCQREHVELILAVGGGSVIDSAKGIAHGLAHPEYDLWDIHAQGLPTEGSAPVACILTLPAAGSESSNSCVLSNDLTHQKYGHSCESNRPVLSVVDPTLFATIPPYHIASGVADMMSHIFERYFSRTSHTEAVDALCEATLRTLLAFGPCAVDDPTDYDAWCQVALCGTMAHNNVLGIGREQDWGAHKLEHELSAEFDVTHGAGLAVLTPAWMRYVKDVCPKRSLDFAVKVMGVCPAPGASETETIEAGVRALEAFYRRMGLPSTLRALGVTEEALPVMAKRAVTGENGAERRVGAYLPLQEADILAIYRMCY